MRTKRSVVVSLAALALAAPALAATPSPADPGGSPGAPGAGDPYFPEDGNGGYDTKHYDLDIAYHPRTDLLRGVAEIEARATQRLSSFNLDLVGMNVRHIRVDGDRADWTRDGQELVVEPRHSLRKGEKFKVKVWYDGVPEPVSDGFGGGFIPTSDGFTIAGQPHVAAYWFPVERPPVRRRVVHLPRDRAQAPRGRGQRRPGRQGPARPGDHVDLEGRRPDGQLPHHGRRGRVRPGLLPRRRDPVRRRDRLRPLRAARRADRRHPAGDRAEGGSRATSACST